MEYLKLIDEYKDEMIETVQQIIRIKSVGEPSISDKEEGFLPFGKGVDDCFKYLIKKAEKDGFIVENVDNYGGHIEFGGFTFNENGEMCGTSEEIVGVLGHLDVVPEGGNWNHDPYGGEIEDGKIFGRGASDDKGPVIASYYAMKALKDSGYIPNRKVRLILGLDEETNWDGIKHYLSKEKAPDIGFTPDADFPVINGEKGILVFELAKKIGKASTGGLEISSIKGGNAPNMVPDNARAVLRGDKYEDLKDIIAQFKSETGYKVNVKGIGKSLEIVTSGISSHGARPDQGLNAISVMMKLLSRFPLVNEDVKEFIDFYNKYIGFEINGESIGCGLEDQISGKLILNVGKIILDKEVGKLIINVRYPVTSNAEQVYSSIMPNISQHNFGVIRLSSQLPIYFKEDDFLVKTLMEVYKKHSGDENSKPIVIGGGTYARAAKNIVAFGATFPGEKEVAHQRDEFIEIESMVKACKIYADAIYQLSEIKD